MALDYHADFDSHDVALIKSADSRQRFLSVPFHIPVWFESQLSVIEYVHQLLRKKLLLLSANFDDQSLQFGRAATKQTVERYGRLRIHYRVKADMHPVEPDGAITRVEDGYLQTVEFRNYIVRSPAWGAWSILAREVSEWSRKLE